MGGAPRPQKVLNRLLKRRLAVFERERHRPIAGADGDCRAVGDLRQRLLERLGRADRRAHEKELRALEDEKRNLPGDPALAVGIVVKLVYDDAVDARVFALAERDIRQDLGRATDDLGVTVHGRIAGDQAHAIGPEVAAEGEELLADEGLDGRRVVAAFSLAQGEEVQRQRNERLAAPRGAGTGMTALHG